MYAEAERKQRKKPDRMNTDFLKMQYKNAKKVIKGMFENVIEWKRSDRVFPELDRK